MAAAAVADGRPTRAAETGMTDRDRFEAAAEMVATAIQTAGVFGENQRITRLIVGNIGRMAAELDAEPGSPGGRALLRHAIAGIAPDDALLVPKLLQGLQELDRQRG